MGRAGIRLLAVERLEAGGEMVADGVAQHVGGSGVGLQGALLQRTAGVAQGTMAERGGGTGQTMRQTRDLRPGSFSQSGAQSGVLERKILPHGCPQPEIVGALHGRRELLEES